jgi:hypothetical protein
MNTSNPSTNTNTTPEASQMIRKDIKAKWDKFSDQELTSLKNKDELVTQVVAKYGLEKGQAVRDVDALLKGREIRHQA